MASGNRVRFNLSTGWVLAGWRCAAMQPLQKRLAWSAVRALAAAQTYILFSSITWRCPCLGVCV